MALFEGERIKIFPETNVPQYEKWISSQGYRFRRSGDYLIVLGKDYPKYDKKQFAKLLTHRMKLKGLTEEQIATEVQVTEYTVWTWEIGRFMPSRYNLNKLMKVLDITEGDLKKCRM